LIASALAFVLSAPAVRAGDAVSARGITFESFTLGGQLFQKNCAECHGTRAQGAEDWQSRGADGKFPAPPLNGTGHSWHHPRAALVRTIRDGTAAIGGNMPAWRDRLSDAEINSIVDWLVSRWPEPAYEAWRRGGHH